MDTRKAVDDVRSGEMGGYLIVSTSPNSPFTDLRPFTTLLVGINCHSFCNKGDGGEKIDIAKHCRSLNLTPDDLEHVFVFFDLLSVSEFAVNVTARSITVDEEVCLGMNTKWVLYATAAESIRSLLPNPSEDQTAPLYKKINVNRDLLLGIVDKTGIHALLLGDHEAIRSHLLSTKGETLTMIVMDRFSLSVRYVSFINTHGKLGIKLDSRSAWMRFFVHKVEEAEAEAEADAERVTGQSGEASTRSRLSLDDLVTVDGGPQETILSPILEIETVSKCAPHEPVLTPLIDVDKGLSLVGRPVLKLGESKTVVQTGECISDFGDLNELLAAELFFVSDAKEAHKVVQKAKCLAMI